MTLTGTGPRQDSWTRVWVRVEGPQMTPLRVRNPSLVGTRGGTPDHWVTRRKQIRERKGLGD